MAMSDDTSVRESFRESILSGRAFLNHWRSHQSRPLDGPPIHHRGWAEALTWLAKLATISDASAAFVRAIGMPPLYQTDGEAAAYLFRQAHTCLAAGYDDVVGRASPEGGRRRDYRRDYTLAERILFLAYLKRATAPFDSCAPGYGALAEVAEAEGVVLPQWPTASW